MCRQLTRQGVAFERSDNKILWVADQGAVAPLTGRFNHIDWPKVFLVLRFETTINNPAEF